jgi:hypothetical protein
MQICTAIQILYYNLVLMSIFFQLFKLFNYLNKLLYTETKHGHIALYSKKKQHFMHEKLFNKVQICVHWMLYKEHQGEKLTSEIYSAPTL